MSSKLSHTPDTEPTDAEIRNTLIDESIITDKRVLKCGHWTHHRFIGKERVNKKPQQFFCERYRCRVCRRKLLEKIAIAQYQQNIVHTQNGGEILLFTFTIKHSKNEELSYLYPRFRTALSQMKKHYAWRHTVKKATNYSYHYENIEIPHNIENGFHLHNHISYGCNPCGDFDLDRIRDKMFPLWSYYTKKNGFPYISKKVGVDITPTHMGMHSGASHYGTKSLDDLTARYGTLEYYEQKIYKQFQKNHKLIDEMDREETRNVIKQLLDTHSQIKKGRIYGRIYKTD